MKNTETVNVFKFNSYVLHLNIDDITHEESLACEPGGSSMNWILGHMVFSRDNILQKIGLAGTGSDDMQKLYDMGTPNVSKENAIDFKKLVGMFDEMQDLLTGTLAEIDYTGKEKELKDITFLAFHEAYHVGQTGILRRIAGKEGAIK